MGRSRMSAPAEKYKVLKSFENPYGDRCIDIFARPDGTFGFEECRKDPEDGADWRPLNRYSGHVFNSEADALAGAKACVEWLKVIVK